MTAIAGYQLRRGSAPLIIAEMSGNHNQSLDRAFAIVDAAAAAGAHAIKLQTYTADTLTIDVRSEGFAIADDASLWKGRHLYDLYKEAYTPWEWHAPIMASARESRADRLFQPVRRNGGGFSRDAECAGLQDRVVRERASAADSQGGRDRQAAHHIHRHGDTRRIGRRGRGCARSGVSRARASQMHQHLSGDAREYQPGHDRRFADALRLRDRPVGSHDGHRRRGGGSRDGRHGHRKALHTGARGRRSRFGLLPGAARNLLRWSPKRHARLPRWAMSATVRPTPSGSR